MDLDTIFPPEPGVCMTVVTTMTDRAPSQCSHPSLYLDLPEWTTCCQENRSRANIATTSSELESVAAETVVINDKHFSSFLMLMKWKR